MLPERREPSDPADESTHAGWPSRSPEWFKDAFQDDYRLLYAGRTAGQARAEVGRIVAELEISAKDRVLDLCCGHGRHLEAFRRLGIPAVGVDLSMQLLAAHARGDAGLGNERPPAGRAPLVRADMRVLPFSGTFDVVVNFFTSFGYFEAEEDHAIATRELAGALKPGGRYSMDLMNPEVAIHTLNPRTERRVEPFDIVERRRYDARTRRIEKHTELRYRPDEESAGDAPLSGRHRSYHESVRVFSMSEITELLEWAGLEVERALGDFDGAPYDAGSPRLIVLGRKPRR